MDAAEQQKARRKEAHRRSMILTGAMTAAAGLAAAWIAFAPGALLPSFRLGRARSPETVRAPMAVRWDEFSAAALAQARRLDRLVLLSVWASWSSQCRLMDETTFADARVAGLGRAQVAPVRVDADERPDLALRYLGAGWPTTALLLPTGEVLDSGTFMSADVLLRWHGAIAQKFRERRAGVIEAAQEAARRRRTRPAAPPADPAAALRRARGALEAGWRGGDQPSFARFDRLQTLTTLRADWAPSLSRRGAAAAMALEDKAAGGFHRALGRRALEPEKLLALQAEALAYLSAADPEAAARLRAYVERALTGPDGGYSSSQAADGAVDRRIFCDENARMAAAVLGDPGASAAQRRHARRAIDALWEARENGLARRRLDGGVRGLLGDQLGLIEALRADGRTRQALELAARLERELLDENGEAFYDRPAVGELPEGLDRIRFASLNARAWRVYRALGLKARADALAVWLWAHPEGLDAADLAALAERF